MTIVKFQRGTTTKPYRQELQFLCSACRPMMLYISVKFHDNILDGFEVTERTQNYHSLISKWNNSKTVQKSYVSCVVHIVWWCFIFLWSFMQISWTVFKLQSRHDCMTDGQTDWQTTKAKIICPSLSGGDIIKEMIRRMQSLSYTIQVKPNVVFLLHNTSQT